MSEVITGIGVVGVCPSGLPEGGGFFLQPRLNSIKAVMQEHANVKNKDEVLINSVQFSPSQASSTLSLTARSIELYHAVAP